MSGDLSTWSIEVRGRVQGVGFRAHAVRQARKYGIKGAVWNRSDGGVELVAQARDSMLIAFVAALREGPGRVEDLVRLPLGTDQVFDDFRVEASR